MVSKYFYVAIAWMRGDHVPSKSLNHARVGVYSSSASNNQIILAIINKIIMQITIEMDIHIFINGKHKLYSIVSTPVMFDLQ